MAVTVYVYEHRQGGHGVRGDVRCMGIGREAMV